MPTKRRDSVSLSQDHRRQDGRRYSPVPLVTSILQGYADRGVFRGFSAGGVDAGTASFTMLWHYDQRYELVLDVRKKTLTFPGLLPGIPAGSDMHRALQKFLHERQSKDVPPHRRVDPTRARLHSINRGGRVSVTVTSKDGDFEYATRRLILIVHEIFLGFLADGPYFEYLVEQFGLDPDRY